MRDDDCTAFLRWCLPRLGLRWQGYRKVRGTACKRIDRRRRELGLADVQSYHAYLEQHQEEWCRLDRLCPIPISRFWRDPEVFECLAADILPRLAAAVRHRRSRTVRCWSAGCASGEEPYSLRLAWARDAEAEFPDVEIEIIACDIDQTMLARARAGVYRPSSVRDVPGPLRACAFRACDHGVRVRYELRRGITFVRDDVRARAPAGRFDLILCRNLAFTYFEPSLQRTVLARLVGRLRGSGYLVIGAQERLPDDHGGLAPVCEGLAVYRLAVR